jgi:hypothetical protein
MIIKVYEVEFYTFDTVDWKDKHYQITATSKQELRESILSILRRGKDDIWDRLYDIEQTITESVLEFPIIKQKEL